MVINGLSPDVERALRSISGPVRYLFPGPERVRTGPVDRTHLLIGPAKNGTAYQRPMFHRLYRMLDQLPGRHVEHFVHPESDYFRLTEEQDVDPWALESRRSIFRFDTWICPLSWPGDWIKLKQLLHELRSYDSYDRSGPLICIVPSSSFPLLEDVSTHADATFTGPSLPTSPEPLQELLNDPECHDPSSAVSSNERDTDDSGPLPLQNRAQVLEPIPFVSSNVHPRYWIGAIAQFDRNHSLQTPPWPTFDLPSPSDVLDQLVDVVNRQGLQHVTIGPVCSQSDSGPDQIEWQLEFLERFHSQWGQRPICYQLDNPRPDHPVWTYEHLIQRYNHTSLHAHLGDVEPDRLRTVDAGTLDRWLNFFLSGGGPGMTVSLDVPIHSEAVPSIEAFCRNLLSINRHSIDGKGQFQVNLQPRLTREDDWFPIDKLNVFERRVQADLEGSDLRIQVQIPEHYEDMRSVRSSSSRPGE